MRTVFRTHPHVGVATAGNDVNDFFRKVPVRLRLAPGRYLDLSCLDLVQASVVYFSCRYSLLVFHCQRIVSDLDDFIRG